MPRFALALAPVLLLVACSPAQDPPFTRSCRGDYVNECRPYTYARITSASLTPEGITLDDPTMQAHVQVTFERCTGHEMPTTVQISAFVGGDGSIPSAIDGGSTNARVIQLGTVSNPDTTASTIDVMIANPFFANVPANTNITLRFATVIDGCEGELFTTPYRTDGLRPMP